MSDRTYVQIHVAECDVPKVDEIFGAADDVDDSKIPGVVILCHNEVDYGGLDEFDSLAKKGMPFLGYSGGGANYGPEVTAHKNTRSSPRVHVTDNDQWLVVRVNKDGTVKAKDLREAKKMAHYIRMVEQILRDRAAKKNK